MFIATKGMKRVVFVSTVLLGVVLAGVPGCAVAQEFTRDKKRDVYLLLQNISGKQIDYKTASGLVPLAMDTTFLGGFGFGYHFNSKLGLRFETMFGETTLRGKGPAAGTSRNVMMSNFFANIDWFLIDRPITPYVTGGIGVQYIEAQLSNIATSAVYYDPWWGYTVTSSYPTYSETDFVPTLGLGVRWDITTNFFLKASIDSSWINYVNVSGTTNQVRYGLTVGAVY